LHDKIGSAVTCSIGVAPNKFLAKVASDMQKPDGLVLLKGEELPGELFRLKLRDLPGINVNMERRLNRCNIHSIQQFWELPPKQARQIWGSVEGERFWYNLHGYDLPEKPTQKQVVGHSRVLDPAIRDPENAFGITRQLTIKAATRLRRYGLYARRFFLSVRSVEGEYWENGRVFSPTQDNFAFIKALEDMWGKMLFDLQSEKLFKVSVSLSGLFERQEITLDLFETRAPKKEQSLALSQSMDALNKRFGVNTVHIGTFPQTGAGYVGTKISFTRIPEKAEFLPQNTQQSEL
jgi:DNA polymerase-4